MSKVSSAIDWMRNAATHRFARQELISGFVAASSEAPVFCFEFTPSLEMEEFGFDLLKRGLFTLPFPNCIFHFPTIDGERATLVCIEHDKLVAALHVWHFADGVLAVSSAIAAQAPTSPIAFKTARDAMSDECRFGMLAGLHRDNFVVKPVMAWNFDRMSAEAKDDAADGGVQMMNAIAAAGSVVACGGLMACVVALMSKDTEKTVQPVSEKLNKARARRGKPPLPVITHVRLARNHEKHAAHGFERSSPIMHWRRGHFRELASGRIVPIPPTIVGAVKGDPLPSTKKEYRVTH